MVFSQLEVLKWIQEIDLIVPYRRIVLASQDRLFPRCLIDIDGENIGFESSESKVLSIISPQNENTLGGILRMQVK